MSPTVMSPRRDWAVDLCLCVRFMFLESREEQFSSTGFSKKGHLTMFRVATAAVESEECIGGAAGAAGAASAAGAAGAAGTADVRFRRTPTYLDLFCIENHRNKIRRHDAPETCLLRSLLTRTLTTSS